MNIIHTILILSVTVLSKVLGYRMCGRQLADMLDLVCTDRGFHWINTGGLPRLSKRSASQYISSDNVFQQRGVVTECCRKECSLEVMESYCAAPTLANFLNPTIEPISEDVANDIIDSQTNVEYPSSLTTAPPPPTTRPPQPSTARSPSVGHRQSVLNEVFFRLNQFKNRNPGFRAMPFFFVKAVGPRPTRTPVVA